MNIKTGIKGQLEITVDGSMTANVLGSGGLEVYSTPSMITSMERTALLSVADYLDEGYTTVGTALNIKHLASTPSGMRVSFESTLEEIDGNRLCFRVCARDENEVIGEGTHERYIVNIERFMEKTNRKLPK